MVRSAGIAVPYADAEATRRRLRDEGLLRQDLEVLRRDQDIVFPVSDGGDQFDFLARAGRPDRYTDLLAWDEADKQEAPRAFDVLGGLAIVKVPKDLWPRRHELGEAILQFLPAVHGVFHDGGVKGEHRIRDLEHLAGDATTLTTVVENGCRLHIDPTKAYYSPRLAGERARVTDLVRPGERFIDLFGGVAPQGVQAAKAGAVVTSVDINPDACRLATRNADENGVDLHIIEGDARTQTHGVGPFDRVVMNLPHGAKEFLDVAWRLAADGAVVHHHEILTEPTARHASLEADAAGHDRTAQVLGHRRVRNYSAEEAHWVFDIEVR